MTLCPYLLLGQQSPWDIDQPHSAHAAPEQSAWGETFITNAKLCDCDCQLKKVNIFAFKVFFSKDLFIGTPYAFYTDLADRTI